MRMDEDRLVRKVLRNCVKPKKETLYYDIPNLDVEKLSKLHEIEKSGRNSGHVDVANFSTGIFLKQPTFFSRRTRRPLRIKHRHLDIVPSPLKSCARRRTRRRRCPAPCAHVVVERRSARNRGRCRQYRIYFLPPASLRRAQAYSVLRPALGPFLRRFLRFPCQQRRVYRVRWARRHHGQFVDLLGKDGDILRLGCRLVRAAHEGLVDGRARGHARRAARRCALSTDLRHQQHRPDPLFRNGSSSHPTRGAWQYSLSVGTETAVSCEEDMARSLLDPQRRGSRPGGCTPQ